MIRRLFLAFIAIVLGSVSVSAAGFSLMTPFEQILGNTGVYGLLNNSVVVFALIYLAYFLGFFNILKIALKPFFGASNPKEAGTVALMLSFIGVTGMFYMFTKGKGIEEGILLFGGSIGFLLLSLVGASVIFWAYGEESKWRWPRTLLMSTFVFIILSMYVGKILEGTFSETWENIYDFLRGASSYLAIAGIIALIKNIRGKRVDATEKFNEKNPDVTSAEESSKKIKKSLDAINSSMKNIKKNMGRNDF
jgi:hypothetical protein